MKKVYLMVMLLSFLFLKAQTIYPYLQAPTSNSIYVNWKTESNTESIVEYGTTPDALTNIVNGSTEVFSDTGYAANYFYHTVKVEGLTPNTKYYYRIKTGAITSDVYSFKTMPLAGEAATVDGHLRFLILGDNQMRNVPRFDSLVSAAKRKIGQKWGTSLDPADNIAMTVMVGDQVDVGTLDHYENVHFKKNKALSGYLPIQTLVGNHETYGTLAMQAYYDHYILDEMSYQGISSGTENYYANQVGNVLFIALDTEHTGAQQLNWVNQVLVAANNDDTVEWIVSLGHRPYQAEQYIGDISQWVRNTVMPVLVTSPKHILHIGAHHHLYHRGQLKDTPTYQIISGGVAWDQYWGMAAEENYEDVQKTISNWMYQIIDVDVNNNTFDVESYSIGSVYQWKDNELMDEFHHYKGIEAPAQPEITNEFDGGDVELPLVIESSDYTTTSEELLNSTQFMIGKNADFDIIEKDVYRDFEDLYGPVGTQVDTSANVNLNVDITKLTLAENEVPNGQYFVKVRHRDQNLSWSPWSDTKSFNIINSTYANTQIQLDTIAYQPNTPITVSFSDTPGNATDWVALYKDEQTPGGGSPSQDWAYTNGQVSGNIVFSGLTDYGMYYATLFENDSYTEIVDRQAFYVGPFVEVTTNQSTYESGSDVIVSYENGPNLTNDWIGIYKVGQTPGGPASVQWSYVTTPSGEFTFEGLADGYYFVEYFLEDGYQSIGERVFFQVGSQITQLAINKTIYNLNENIIATWTDAPGIIKDWIGIYNEGDDPNEDELVSYTYFDGQPEGSKIIPDENLPTEVGGYFIVIFTDDSYNEVSNRVSFQVEDPNAGLDEFSSEKAVMVYPNPVKKGEKTFVKCKYPIDQIDVFDMTGNLFYTSKNINDYNFSLINQSLPTGVYLLKIHSNKIYNVKVIVD
ncbi:T9SS type A sorting domain-containing protein [Flavobacterium salilacus subsp. salilacus]|uniref:fibronectin type III domain-containing protein n=1 Tax=Flavobacterium TaxID=237 RepID=UPI001074EB01|nr:MULTISPECIES: fibronectin type III domain-containing protein [Flavobacterium]KAF2519837.1 T9SS type A sorting domain-containing protein [Flavobacterium salilacus subsp. salilacus]MBE1614264.1 fibronectin type III domain-containing protein [Flavobacterium sp. SaA2.13]